MDCALTPSWVMTVLSCLAYNQKVGAESAVDINLAKQLNTVMTQLGVSAQSLSLIHI